MKKTLLFVLVLITIRSMAQVVNTATMDTTSFNYQGKVSVEGYIDAYYGFDFNRPTDNNRPYFVSMSRHNEMTVNLAYIDVKYSSSRLRARFVPGFGTFINANYAGEPGSLKNIIEASAGVRLFPKKRIWLDAGVFGSPYTNESAISKDHLAYTRSFAPEYVPYYLSGLKLTVPLHEKVNGYLYLLNGWQQIQDVNRGKAVGTQIEYRPNNYWLLNWNTYIGSEESAANPTFRTRYFTDAFFIYSKEKWSATGCAYIGLQERSENGSATWWQVNLIGRYQATRVTSVTGRVEYFDDPDRVQINPVTGLPGFSSYSTSVGLNFKVAENVLVRFEGRTFFSDKEMYLRESTPVNTSHWFTSNITLWF
jgi:hypothetical protein